MRIQNIFRKDINRPINGVVKADDNEETTVYQELDEYVVTKELDRHFRTFFESFGKDSGTAAQANNIGVWVSGFFGSGKSHFIKILSYLLANREVSNETGETKSALEFFDREKIKDAMLNADINKAVQVPTDVILFNIDSKDSKQEGLDSITNVFLKVFNDFCGFSADHPHVAHMERYLSEKGKYDAFKEAFEAEAGVAWMAERDAYHFYQDAVVEAISKVLNMSTDAANSWFNKSESDFRSQFSIENFCKWVKEYLDSKSKDSRIMFLVDEVGQFIGQDTSRMLKLQTITEELGTICKGRAWVVVTSQEDIEAVVDRMDKSKEYDFSKIQGRFKTKISLSSSNTDEVIQSRILTKTDDAKSALSVLFGKKGDIIKNQVSFDNTGSVIRNFLDEKSFIDVYPFAPYQFDLVQKIFESIRKAGATGMHLSRGERSMLDAFQNAAIINSEKEIGCLVPVYDFYPTIENFIDTAVKMAIDKAVEDTYLEEFDIQLLKALFLIRYVETIKGTIDNLATLCLSEIDQDKIALKAKITASLERLERQNKIVRNGEIYQFLTKAEQDVTRAIKQTDIGSYEENNHLIRILFKEILQDNNKYKHDKNSNIYNVMRLLDGHMVDSTTNAEITFEIVTQRNENYEAYTENYCLTKSNDSGGKVIAKLSEDKTLFSELTTYIKTETYIRKNNDGSDPEHQKILLEKTTENRERAKRLKAGFEKLLLDADYYAFNAMLSNKGTVPQTMFKEACQYLLENTFNKLDYITKTYADPLQEMSAILSVNDLAAQNIDIDNHENSSAIKEIEEYIRIRSGEIGNIMVQDVLDRFYNKRPYGWRDGEVLVCLAILNVAGRVTFSSIASQSAIPPRDVIEYLKKTNKRREITVVKKRQTDEAILKEARDLGNEMFGQRGPSAEKELYEFLLNELKDMLQKLQSYKTKAEMGKYPGKAEIDSGITLIKRIVRDQDSYEFFKQFTEQKVECLKLEEDFYDLDDFYSNKIGIWQKLEKALNRFEPSKFHLEADATAKDALDKLNTIYNNSRPYPQIKDVEGLIVKIEAVLDSILKVYKEEVTKHADDLIDRLRADIAPYELTADESNRVMMPLQNEKKRIEEQTTTATLIALKDALGKKFDDSLAEAEEIYMSKQSKETTPPSGGGDTKPEPQKPIVKKTVYAKDYISRSAPKTFIETEDDVERFVTRLKEELTKAVKEDKRIRIQ